MNDKAEIKGLLFIIIFLFATLPHVTAEMYVPSLPAIAQSLHATTAQIQLSLAFFMLGFSVTHLVYGPLSDKIGRKKPMVSGIGLSLIGTGFCLFASNVYILFLGRLLQGIGMAACNALGRSLMRDLVAGNHLARISSHLGMVMVIVMTIAPTLGGYIQYYFNWHAVFFVLFLYTLGIWILTLKYLPETHFNLNPHATKIKVMLTNYKILLSSPVFMGYVFCVMLAYGSIIAYVTTAPFLIQTLLGYTPSEFGWLSFITGVAIFSSFFLNSRLVVKVGIARMVLVGSICMVVAGSIFLLLGWLGYFNVIVILLPVSIFCVGAGFMFSNASAGAIHAFPEIAGIAGGLYGCLQILGGAISSGMMAMFHQTNQMVLAYVFFIFGVLSVFSWMLTHKK